jgi:integron integrase
MDDIPKPINADSPKFLEQLRLFIRAQNKAYTTEQAYIAWCRRFIYFHNKRDPRTMGPEDIERFLSHLAINNNVAINTQKTALNALMFMFNQFLKADIKELDFNYAKVPRNIPVVFTHDEALAVVAKLEGNYKLMANLMYGSGLRVSECVRLRVQDLDFGMNNLIVRNGKGNKSRCTILPTKLVLELKQQIDYVEAQHRVDMRDNVGEVYLPHALSRKYPRAATQLAWQYVFPAKAIAKDPRSDKRRRHHVMVSSLQKQVGQAIREARILKKSGSHTFRHSFATRLLIKGYDIRTIQELLGHNDIRTTEIYLHVVRQGGRGVISPIDDE